MLVVVVNIIELVNEMIIDSNRIYLKIVSLLVI